MLIKKEILNYDRFSADDILQLTTHIVCKKIWLNIITMKQSK